MSLYEVTVTGTVLGQQAIWRSNWRHINIDPLGTAPAYRLLQALGYNEGAPDVPTAGRVFAQYMACAIASAGVTSLFCRNLYDPFDFSEIPLTDPWIGGRASGAYFPPNECGTWVSNRTNLNVRRGHASTWGMSEADVSNESVIIGTALIDAMDEWADTMSSIVTHTIGFQIYDFRSCILSKERYMVSGTGTDPITNPARWAYRYYETESEQLEHAALGVSWARQQLVSTRNSRKVGRGR